MDVYSLMSAMGILPSWKNRRTRTIGVRKIGWAPTEINIWEGRKIVGMYSAPGTSYG